MPKSFLPSECNSITGCLQTDKKSCCKNFNKAKKSNVIRIGCFGDSYTLGNEVNDTYDYPTLLGDIFKRHGYDNVEVINFGMGGIGFHQAFNIWKFIGKEYNLDYVIFGPGCFQYDRDSTFTASLGFNIKDSILNLHARYVLKNKSVELIDLRGNNFKARAMNYLSFIPYSKYLSYDMLPPAFLAAPLYCFLPNRKLSRNPFYYKNNFKKEMSDIYKILFNEIAIGAPQVILCNYRNEIVNLGKSLNRDNVLSFYVHTPDNFPYKAACGHNSPNGNKLLAQQLFDCLTGKNESIQPVIETSTTFDNTAGENRIQKARLFEYTDIGIEVKGIKLGHFYDPTVRQWSKYCAGQECVPLVNTLSDVTSIIAFQDKTRSILDWVFLSLETDINENMPVTIRVRNINGSKDFALAKVGSLYPGLNIGIVDIGPYFFNQESNLLTVKKNILLKAARLLEDKGEIIVLLQNIPVLSAKIKGKSKNLEFHSVSGRFLTIRADGREIVDTPKLEQTGPIYLFLESKQQESVLRIPLASWIKIDNKLLFGKRILLPVVDAHLK